MELLEPGNEQSVNQRAPWWAWAGPACAFLLFLTLFWPRPYAIPSGDGLTYYSGARHIAAEGRYYSDYDYRPAVPITRHPPLFSMLWGGLIYLGVSPVVGLWLIHATFLAGMGAAGGALAYRITRSGVGPLFWTILSCCWPGGDNWVYWLRPLTESGTAALFVIICWMSSYALRKEKGHALVWLFSTCMVAGLSMILKVTGAFCFPVVGLVAIVITLRRHDQSRWWIPPVSAVIMVAPYFLWVLRNVALIGEAESGKISHEPELMWGLMSNLSRDVTAWLLPAPWAQRAEELGHPLVVVLPLVFLPLALTALAQRRKCPEALLTGACTAISFMALGLMMTTKFTEETRYWSVMWPCLALALLVLGSHRPAELPASPFRLITRLAVTLLAMYCCARFAASRQQCWHATQVGFYFQQLFISATIVLGGVCLHRLFSSMNHFFRAAESSDVFSFRQLCAILISAFCAIGIWRFTHTPAPFWTIAPVAIVGLVPVLPIGTTARGRCVRWALSFLLLGCSWWQAGWRWVEPIKPLAYQGDGILVEVRPDILRAREAIKSGDWPEKFVSNCEEYMIDLFGDHAVLPLPWYCSIARFRCGLPQLPEDDERVKREWLAELRLRSTAETFVMIILPTWPARSHCYGPSDFEDVAGLTVDWRVHDDNLHIAECRLSPP